jgi:hypothetical protein
MSKKLIYLVVVMILGLAPMNLVYGYDPDLIAWWTCDEGAGTVVGDASGNGHDGTFVYGNPSWVEGNRGSAVQLTGPTLIEIPPLDVVLTEATMAGWIKTNGSQPDWSSFIMTRTPGLATGFNVLGFQLAYHWNDTSTSWDYRGGDMIPDNEWTFCAVTVEPDKATFYVNGVAGSVNEINHGPCTWNSNIYLGGDGNDEWIARRMNGALDDISLFSRALTADEILALMEGIGAYPTASSPTPADGTILLDTWVNLAWGAGDFAVSHDVYLGENFDDVNDGAAETFQGNQAAMFFVAGFPGFAYPDGLIPGTTYYWRIDEVNDTEPNSPWKGKVWSFTIPPRTAYNPGPADAAELVAPDVKLSWTAGFGAKLHYVYFGNNFDDVNNATVGKPLGSTSYTPGPLKLAKTYYWRVDEFDAIATYKGEVWSFTTQGAIGSPDPSNGAVDVKQIPVLSWSPGVYAASHQVYFGTDEDAVKNADTGSTEYKGTGDLGSEVFEPGKLLWDTTYYWRIDEVNNVNPDSPWVGPVWSFTTANFLIVDDFEDYDMGNNEIWWAWKDGLGYAAHGNEPAYPGNGTGSMVGDETTGSYCEETIVHGGSQSMPLFYDNSVLRYSEAQKTLTYPRDWTENGVNTLTIWFRGNPAGFVEDPSGTITMSASGADIWGQADEFRYAWKQLSGAGSISAQVLSVENTDGWAKAGLMIRESLAPGSKFAFVFVSPANGCRFQARVTTGADAMSDDSVTTLQAIEAPHWIKLERNAAGDFNAYNSDDGVTWSPLAWNPRRVLMSPNVYIGIALTSHNSGVTCTAEFSNVQTTGTVTPTMWTHEAIGATMLSNDAEPMYVALNGNAVVVHDNPNASLINDWTEWPIDLQAFADQGVNLANINTIALGLGNKKNPVAGGSGTMYFDDICLYLPPPEPAP